MIYTVKLEAFGHIRVWNYEADSQPEAEQKALDHAGFRMTVVEQPTLDSTHTGGTLEKVR